MNNSHEEKFGQAEPDSFDNFLSAHLQQARPYLMDDGFALQVMNKLPATKKLSRWQEWLIISVPLIIISVIVLSQPLILGVCVKTLYLLLDISVIGYLKMAVAMVVAIFAGIGIWFAKELRLF